MDELTITFTSQELTVFGIVFGMLGVLHSDEVNDILADLDRAFPGSKEIMASALHKMSTQLEEVASV